MKKKGFTLVELLVVIAIIAMLLAILMPALGKVRALAYRLMCATNLGGLGKACAVYSNDYQEQYPVRSGGATLTWGNINTPDFWDKNVSTTTFDWTTVTKATVTSSLYLLVKYSDVSTNQFVCKAGSYKKFELVTTGSTQNATATGIKDPTEAWDFGKVMTSGGVQVGPWNYCGYSYQMPYAATGASATAGPFVFALSASSPSGCAVMADASPWYKNGAITTPYGAPPSSTNSSGTAPYLSTTATDWGIGGSAKKDVIKLANSPNHSQEGQNVLYMDSHVAFENQTNVGINQDNIYTRWPVNTSGSSSNLVDVQAGVKPSAYAEGSMDSSGNDSFLAN